MTGQTSGSENLFCVYVEGGGEVQPLLTSVLVLNAMGFFPSEQVAQLFQNDSEARSTWNSEAW